VRYTKSERINYMFHSCWRGKEKIKRFETEWLHPFPKLYLLKLYVTVFGKRLLCTCVSVCVSGWYWAFSIIISACYTGSIIAFVTIPVYPSYVDNCNDVLDRGYKVGTLSKSCSTTSSTCLYGEF